MSRINYNFIYEKANPVQKSFCEFYLRVPMVYLIRLELVRKSILIKLTLNEANFKMRFREKGRLKIYLYLGKRKKAGRGEKI